MTHQFIAALLLGLVAQAQTPAPRTPNFGSVTRVEEYRTVTNTNYGSRSDGIPACYDTINPTPVNTPNPLLNGNASVTVDFIVGWDGVVYSPFVLEGSVNDPDVRAVLQAMRGWRFRPGKCNGAPTSAEGRVKFRKTP
jgi:hypothetical protein